MVNGNDRAVRDLRLLTAAAKRDDLVVQQFRNANTGEVVNTYCVVLTHADGLTEYVPVAQALPGPPQTVFLPHTAQVH